MPKEVIYGSQDVYGEESSARSIIDVRWSRGKGFVEIGSRIVYAVDTSADYVPTEEERPGSGGKPIRGLYLSLDRSGINDMIRHLRRARDQAFGRDE